MVVKTVSDDGAAGQRDKAGGLDILRRESEEHNWKIEERESRRAARSLNRVTKLSASPRILDLDGSLAAQTKLLKRATSVATAQEPGPHLRYLCTKRALNCFATSLDNSQRHHLTFYGSGDFHHLTAVLLRAFRVPLSVVVFDQHPDWDITSPVACCGSWVNAALKLPHIKKIVVIGAGAEDLGGHHLLRGNTTALRNGRLEIYPATFARSQTLSRRTRRLRCARQSDGFIHWKTVAQMGWDDLLTHVIAGLPTRQIYVSIDKDCLVAQSAISNWDAGELGLDDVCAAIERLGRERAIVGADVTGEWSAGQPASPLFRAVSRADHPNLPTPSEGELARNQDTNLRLLDAFLAIR